MHYKYKYLLTLFFVFAAIAPAAAQDDFCSVLTNVIEASKQKFNTIKTGEPTTQEDFFGKMQVYQCSLKMPGAESTTINKGIKLEYQAVMAKDHSKSEKMNTVYNSTKDQLKSCLGSGYKYEEIPNDINGMMTFKAEPSSNTQKDLYKPTIVVRYGQIDNSYQVQLVVGEPFFAK